MNKKKYDKGFTLLELLIVIAVIGILTAIVVASLSSSRAKGADAAIKSNLANIRAQAELVSPTLGNTYGTRASGSCPGIANTGTGTIFHDTKIKTAIQSSAVQAGGTVAGSGVGTIVNYSACASNGTSWAAAVTLRTGNTSPFSAWCVDSSGRSKRVSVTSGTSPTSAYALVSGVYSCN